MSFGFQRQSSVMLAPITLDHPQFDALAGDILSSGNVLRFKALGRSMLPFIKERDVLTVHPAAASRLRVGHVALHRRTPAGVTAHRIVRIHRGGASILFDVRGDGSCSHPATVAADQILGRVTCVERGGKVIDPDSSLFLHGGRLWSTLQSLRGWIRRIRHK